MSAVDALQRALAGEHAALALYGVLGARAARVDPTALPALEAAYSAHRDARDTLTTMIAGHGVDPQAALPDYALPGPATTPTQLVAVARVLETRLTRVYGELVSQTAGEERRYALGALGTTAQRGQSFGVAPTDFPGFD